MGAKLPQSCIVRIATYAHFCSAIKAIHALKNEMRWKPGYINEGREYWPYYLPGYYY
jgi:hypothetical protein